jgi:hypothetical protein
VTQQRRTSLPGASELFRTTAPSLAQPASVPAPVAEARPESKPESKTPAGRRKHDEKITVYCSGDELLALERARLQLRAEYGLAIDRGRIVREALAVVLAELEAKGAESSLIRKLRDE